VHCGAHVAHARGVSAILMSKSSPFDLICGGKLFQVPTPLPLNDLEMESSRDLHLQHYIANNNKVSPRFSILCTPLLNQSNSVIDTLFIQIETLIQRARSLLASEVNVDQLYRLKSDAEKLNEACDAWPESLCKQWEPRSVGIITSKDDKIS
jgi:hypothetical protein